MSSLTFYLQMNQVMEKFNLLVEGVKQKAPGSPAFHSELGKLHGEIEHLRAGIKSWNRLLSLGAVPRVPTNSLMELQRERSRIFHKIQVLESEVDKVGLHNTFSVLSQHREVPGRFQSSFTETSWNWNSYHPHPLGLGLSSAAVMPVAPNATPPHYPNELRVPLPGDSASGWCSCPSTDSSERDYRVFSSATSTLSSASAPGSSGRSGINGMQ